MLKNSKTVIIMLAMFFTSFNMFGSGISFEKIIDNYYWNPSSGFDGRFIKVKFKLVYDWMMQEPLVKVAAEVIEMGPAVNYKGQTWTDPKLIKSVKPFHINVSVDIMDNDGHRVSTVVYTKLLEFDVSASPGWGDVWPGVSAERTKRYFFERFHISNVQLVDLQFDYSALDQEIRRLEAFKKKQEEINALKTKADNFWRAENFSEALSTYERILGIDEKNSDAIYSIGKLKELIAAKEQKQKEQKSSLVSGATFKASGGGSSSSSGGSSSSSKDDDDDKQSSSKQAAKDTKPEKKSESPSKPKSNDNIYIPRNYIDADYAAFTQSPFYFPGMDPWQEQEALGRFKLDKFKKEESARMEQVNDYYWREIKTHTDYMQSLSRILSDSEDPLDLIHEAWRNEQKLEKESDEVLKKRNEQTAAEVDHMKRTNDGKTIDVSDVYGAIVKGMNKSDTKDELEEKKKQLDDDLKRKMRRILEKYVRNETQKAKECYANAAIAFYETDEKYYLDLYKYHTTASEYAQANFEHTNANWVYTKYNRAPEEVITRNPDQNESSAEFLKTAKRKLDMGAKLNNDEFTKNGNIYLNEAINRDPSNAEAYFVRSKNAGLIDKYRDVLSASHFAPQNPVYTSAKVLLRAQMAENYIKWIETEDLDKMKELFKGNLHLTLTNQLKKNPYYAAIDADKVNSFAIILNTESNKNEFLNLNGHTLLLAAIYKKSQDCTNWLLDAGVDPNAQPQLPLIAAAQNLNFLAFSKLIDKKADFQMAMNTARDWKNTKTCDILYTYYADKVLRSQPIETQLAHLAGFETYLSLYAIFDNLVEFIRTDKNQYTKQHWPNMFNSADEYYHQKCVELNDLAKYRDYMRVFCEGSFKPDVTDRINRLDQQKYSAALAANNYKAYYSYLKDFPFGLNYSEAVANRNLQDQKEFDYATSVGTQDAFRGYLNNCPEGSNTFDVKRALDLRIDFDAYTVANNIGTIDSYHEYLNKFPYGKYSEKAISNIAWEKCKGTDIIGMFLGYEKDFPLIIGFTNFDQSSMGGFGYYFSGKLNFDKTEDKCLNRNEYYRSASGKSVVRTSDNTTAYSVTSEKKNLPLFAASFGFTIKVNYPFWVYAGCDAMLFYESAAVLSTDGSNTKKYYLGADEKAKFGFSLETGVSYDFHNVLAFRLGSVLRKDNTSFQLGVGLKLSKD